MNVILLADDMPQFQKPIKRSVKRESVLHAADGHWLKTHRSALDGLN